MKKTIYNLASPLISLFLLNVSIGFVATLIPVLLNITNTNPITIGLMATANYTGLVIGSFRAERFILRVGHIRAFAAFAASLSTLTLVQGMTAIPEIWILLRFIVGICLAGLYVVIESWLLSSTDLKIRGRVLAIYMVSLYSAQASGQFFVGLDLSSPIFLFALATIFSALSILPLTMTNVQSPKIEEPSTLNLKELLEKSLSGVVGCFSAGLILGSLYGLYPLFIAKKFGGQAHLVGYLMAALIAGGMFLQYPIGKLSDVIERRTVLGFVCLSAAMLCSFFFIQNAPFFLLLTLSFILGGFTFTIYVVRWDRVNTLAFRRTL